MKISDMQPSDRRLLDSFIAMSRAVGNRPDCIQAGGGNTSVKFGDIMAVKCSGCQLKDMKEDFGYVCLPYERIRDIFARSDRGPGSESDTSRQVNDSIMQFEDLAAKRPSVEAGFHAMLGNAVIHSHAVNANILNCIEGGESIINDIMSRNSVPCLVLPFINPGAELTFAIMDAKNSMGDKFPQVIFLKNHGLVVWADTAEEAIALNSRVLDILGRELALPDYPTVSLNELPDGKFASGSELIASMLADGTLSVKRINETPLYPDQLVYLNSNLADGTKLSFDKTAVYNCAYDTAYSLEETLLAYAYLLHVVDKNGYQLSLMPQSGIQFILGWDAEKYRRQMIR